MQNWLYHFTVCALIWLTACQKADGPGPLVQSPPVVNESDPTVKAKSTPAEDMELWVNQDFSIGQYGGTLLLGTPGNPKSLNPILSNEATSTSIFRMMFSECWGFHNQRQEGIPGLCADYERSLDGLTYTFRLRKGIRWSDGHPITSSDVAFSYAVATDPAIPNTVKDQFRQDRTGMNEDFARLEILDQERFRFRLQKRDVLFQFAVGNLPILPKHIWAQAYARGVFGEALSAQKPLGRVVSSGPFVMESYTPNQNIVFVRNPYFWQSDQAGNRLPYLDGVKVAIARDQNGLLNRFRDGQIHIHTVREEEYQVLKGGEAYSNYRVYDLGPSFDTTYLMFNLDARKNEAGQLVMDPIRRSWFVQNAFRSAVSHAIDRENIVRNVLNGRGQPLWNYVSPADKRWYNPRVARYPHDPKKALSILKKAGFRLRGDRLFDRRNRPVEFTLITNAERDSRVLMLSYIKSDLEAIGMQIRIEPLPFNAVLNALRDTRRFDAVVLGWSGDAPPDPAGSRNVLLSRGRSHLWHPEQEQPATPWEKRMDELMDALLSTPVYEERKQHSDELFKIFSDHQPQIQLVVGHDAAAAYNLVGNFAPTAVGLSNTTWNLPSLYLKD